MVHHLYYAPYDYYIYISMSKPGQITELLKIILRLFSGMLTEPIVCDAK